jgi:ketosteroid isomerase-like protein
MMRAFNARDVDGWMAGATDDFRMESRFSSVAGTVFRGREGVEDWWRDLSEAWEWMEVEIEDTADVTPDRSVLVMALRGHGRGSGMRLEEPVAQRWRWRGDRLESIEYVDRLEAEMMVRGQS